jgi:hypothetical protein
MLPKKFVLPGSNEGLDLLPPVKKPRQTKQRRDGITNVEWAADIQCRATVNLDRHKREVAAKAKKSAAAARATAHCPDVFDRDEATSGELKPHAGSGPTRGTKQQSTAWQRGRRSGGGFWHLNLAL